MFVVVHPAQLGAGLHRVERRLGDVDIASFDELRHVAEEERQQQRPNVGTVHVGIREDDHLVIAGLGDVHLVADAGANTGDQRLHLSVLEDTGQPVLLDVDDLAPNREDRLEIGIARLFG